MALWNPFNLFKKKETKPAAEPAQESVVVESEPATTQPTTASPAKPPTASAAPQVETTVPTATSNPPSTTSDANPDAVPAEIHPQVVASESVSLPTVEEVKSTEPHVEPQAPIEAEPAVAKTVEAKAAEVEPASEIHPDRMVPFDEQVAPAKPVDLYEKISQKPTVEKAKKAAEPEAAGGLTGWFRSAISKTAKVLNTDIRDLVGREGRLVDDAFLKELFTHLVKTDMGVAPASEIRDAIAKKYRARKVHLSQLIAEAKTTISEIMKQDEVRLQLADEGTTVIMVVGVNGSGKTTSIAKLARMFRQDGKSVVLGAGDTFRAAAVEQLRQWAGRIGADIVTGEDQSDPASVAYKAAQFAKDNQIDICIVDTAGRLQTQSHLMQELSKIRRVLDKVIPGSPHETLLVLDSTAGQNAISQARGFSEAAGCSGIVLAKLDGTAKGGVAIPIRKEFDLPVKFIGFGETADAIAPFDVPRYVDALFNFDEK